MVIKLCTIIVRLQKSRKLTFCSRYFCCRAAAIAIAIQMELIVFFVYMCVFSLGFIMIFYGIYFICVLILKLKHTTVIIKDKTRVFVSKKKGKYNNNLVDLCVVKNVNLILSPVDFLCCTPFKNDPLWI